MINVLKLKGKVVEKYGSQAKFAEHLNISEASWIKRLQGTRDFKLKDIEQVIALLGLTDDEVWAIFFNKE